MIETYRTILQALDLPSGSIDRATPYVAQLHLGLKDEKSFWGFPPALIPLWCDPDLLSYIGFWKHWFCERRVTFVEFLPGGVEEVATSFDQLISWLVFRGMYSADKPLPAAVHLAEACNLKGLDALRALRKEARGDERALLRLKLFRDDPPLGLLEGKTKYRGAFPNTGNVNELAHRHELSWFEATRVAKQIPERWRGSLPWLFPKDLPAVFRQRLAERDLLGAWMALNGPGWTLTEASSALSALAKVARDQRFNMLVRAWKSANKQPESGY